MDPTRIPGVRSLADSSPEDRADLSALELRAQEPNSPSNEPMPRTPAHFDDPASPENPSQDGFTPALGRSQTGALPRWMTRIFVVIEVVIWVELGIILVIAPWSAYWSGNSLALSYPRLHDLLGMSFIRGAVSGIGVLDIFAGIWDLLRYRDPARNP